MSDTSSPGTFDLRAFLSSLGEEPTNDGLSVVTIRSHPEQRAFVARALDALLVVPDIAESRLPLFSSATQAVNSIGAEARVTGYYKLADVLTELVWELLRVRAARAERDGEWGPVLESIAPHQPDSGQTAAGIRRKWSPLQSTEVLRGVNHGLFHACRLLLEIYLTGSERLDEGTGR